MKKIILLLMVILVCITFIGCKKNDSNNYEGLNIETETYIKQCVINYHKSKNSEYNKTLEDIIIKYYFGDFDGVKIAVIKGDTISILNETPFYICTIDGEIYLIKYLPEVISVYYENNYYTLVDACKKDLITKEILDKLDCYY